ncbi:MAG TPA: ABC transporter permease [Verrucomicrobiae bacterium]|jgi:putative ABC transport system permease protein|nr:ABC transporter permease [Verrucomicrobiae bacterium]
MNFLTELREGLAISWSAIRANRMRSVLATLGIVIGIVTVTLMGTAIEGLNRSFEKSISFIGGDVLYVDRGSWFMQSYEEWRDSQKRPALSLSEADGLAEQLTLSSAVTSVASTDEPVKYKKHSSGGVSIIGTTENFMLTMGFTVDEGRFLSAAECDYGRPVCVIGATVATNLFPHESPLGSKVLIGNLPFQVVGVLDKQGGFVDKNVDNQVMIPMPQYISHFDDSPDLQIQVKVKDMGQVDEAKDELRLVMRRLRRLAPNEPDNFAINQQDQILTMFHAVAGTIGAIGLFVTGLSLFVGGIGIMNIMFVSVAERTREIGIRKAIGAKRRTILLQFLIEAASICLMGGGIALAIAWPVTLLMQRMMPAELSLNVVAIALGVALVTGVLAGFFPAWRAARMNPVDALRNE